MNTRDRTLQAQHRMAEVVRLRTQGWTLQAIADQLGYRSKSSVSEAWNRAMREIPSEAVAEARALETARLDRLIEEAWKLYERRYPVVSFGKIWFEVEVKDGTMIDVEDVGPKLAALKEIRQLGESRRRLLGTDAPTRHRVEFVPEDALDAEIRRMAREAGLERAEEADIGAIEAWLGAQG